MFGISSRVHGDRISFVTIDDTGVVDYEVFAWGFLRTLNSSYTRRPVDVVIMPDGSILISDDEAQMIYRVYYSGG